MLAYSIVEPESIPNVIEAATQTPEQRRRLMFTSNDMMCVLAALINEDRHPKGGKSINLIAAEYARLFLDNDTLYHKVNRNYGYLAMIRGAVDELIRSGLVVRSITGAYFFKPYFRSFMDQQGISYLPTWRGRKNV